MELIRSKVLRSPHGFSSREGGVSLPPYEALNLSNTVGDDPAAVTENLERLAKAMGSTAQRLATVRQVHGDVVLPTSEGGERGEADGLVTNELGLFVGVKTADCLPVLMEGPGGVAAVHAGWHGVEAEIVTRALAHVGEPSQVWVALGPAIRACCFEVDGDLPARFAARFGSDVVVPKPNKSKVHLDLALAVCRSLERAGVPTDHVDVLPHCTVCDRRFFSHRRDRGVTGRHLSLISRR